MGISRNSKRSGTPTTVRPNTRQSASHSAAASLQRATQPSTQATPSHILNLQRHVGNRAIQRLLDDAPVQRQATVGPEGGEAGPDVQAQLSQARHGGQPLDRGVSNKVGGALGADFSNVRIHADAQADTLNRSLGAEAFTHGPDIFFSRSAYNPGSTGGQHLLAHELTHVVQQGQGSSGQRGGGNKSNHIQTKLTVGAADDAYEREADHVANQVMRPGNGAVSATSADPHGGARRHLRTQTGGPRIQRTVKMYESFEDARKASKNEPITGAETELTVADVDTAMGRVNTAMSDAGMDLPAKTKSKMKTKLKEWIKKDAQMSQVSAWLKKKFTGGTSLNTGLAQDKRFGSYLTLGQALLGHIQSRQHKKTESKLSAKIKKSSYIKNKLREVQRAIFQAVEAITDQQMKDKFWGGMSGDRAKARPGHYYHWYKNVKNVKTMMQAGTGDFKQAITSIHDVSDVMIQLYGAGTSGKQASLDKGALDTWATKQDFQGTVEGEDGNTTRKDINIGYRANSTTVNEDYDWVKTARAHGALLWAGPSHTTANMMRLMKSLQVKVPAMDVTHLEAVAWAIFAFWNKDFFTFKDGYHTFHEVMDIAKGYGVPYEPFTYPSEPPPAHPDTDTEEEEPQWQVNPGYESAMQTNPLYEGK